MKKTILILLSLPVLFSGAALSAQELYLMPSFEEGVVYFTKQAPARGKLNIFAVDQSLRFLDDNGKELEATNIDDVVRVVIDTVSFLRKDNAFYRLYPVSRGMGVAFKRKIELLTGAKVEAYGTVSQTSSVTEYKTLHTSSGTYSLEGTDLPPYNEKTSLFFYEGNSLYPANKKGLKKLFPDRKDEIEAYLKAGHRIPGTLPELIGFLDEFTKE